MPIKLENDEKRAEILSVYIEPYDKDITNVAGAVELPNKPSFDDKFNAITWVIKWIKDNLKFRRNVRGVGSKVGEVLNKFRYGCCIEFAHVAVSLLRSIGFDQTEVFVVVSKNINDDNKFHAYFDTSRWGYHDPTDDDGLFHSEDWQEMYRHNDDQDQFWKNPYATKLETEGAFGFICGL